MLRSFGPPDPTGENLSMLTIRNVQIQRLGHDAREQFVLRVSETIAACPANSVLSAEQRLTFVERAISQAEDYGLSTEKDIAAFVVLHFLTAPDPLSTDPPGWVESSFQDLSIPPAQRVHALLDAVLGPTSPEV